MRKETIHVYRFKELPEKAKERAKEKEAELFGYAWADQALQSIEALAEHFGGKVKDYQIDWFGGSPSFMYFDMPDMTRAEITKRLMRLGSYNRRTGKGHGECKLTGFCMDEDAIDGFRAAFRRGEMNLNALMHAAFARLLKAGEADCEDQYSDETFAAHCDANGYEFYSDGTMFRKGAK